ncbi:MAG: hypothetical protein NT011_10445 [Kiritimatiellaeota bacterium]|nr:hypothetical protein [Kiritimatiellota bacterium]
MDYTEVPSGENNDMRSNVNAITPAQILCLAKGFSRIFWGVLLMVGLFLSQAGLEVFHGIRIPAYVLGAGLIGWGLWLLQSAGPARRSWQRHTRLALGLAFLIIYFAPFITWWQAMPYENLFLINVLGLLLTGMGILLLVNLLAAETFGLFEERGGRVESQVFAFGVVILMIAPFLIGLLFALVASMRYNAPFAEEIWLTINRIPIWLYVATTLPCSLTMVAAWKAKTICYQRLWNSGAKPDDGRQTTDDGF